jgi:predicted nucleic acid-binding protein
MILLDTSALFKRYFEEEGTEIIDQIFNDESRKCISALTITELSSNLKRMCSIDKIISDNIMKIILNKFHSDIKTRLIVPVPVNMNIIIISEELVIDKYMTPIDSIILATAKYLSESTSITLISSDNKMCKIAENNDIKTINPVK